MISVSFDKNAFIFGPREGGTLGPIMTSPALDQDPDPGPGVTLRDGRDRHNNNVLSSQHAVAGNSREENIDISSDSSEKEKMTSRRWERIYLGGRS